MNPAEDLEKLAEACLAAAKTIKQHFADNGLPPMSFDQNGPAFFPDVPPAVQYARLNLRGSAQKLADLVTSPDEFPTQHLYNCIHDVNAARYIDRFGIAKIVPFNDTISYDDLAAKAGVDASQLKRQMRQLMNIHMFCEPEPDRVAHTASSKLLLHWGVDSFFRYLINDTFEISQAQIPALEKWGHGSQEHTETALTYHYKTDKSMFAYYDEVPEIGERFGRLMKYVSSAHVMSNTHVGQGFDWASLPPGSTVVDVGGSLGHCSVPMAQANPGIKCIVQDRASMIERATNDSTSVVPKELRHQFEFMPHDFFQPQPVKNATVYFLRMIMQDYSDKYASIILKHIRDAMGPNSRIVIMDQLLLPVGSLPAPFERLLRTTDMQMMLLLNAKERDYGEFSELLAGVDPRLKIVNVITPAGSAMSLLECGLAPE